MEHMCDCSLIWLTARLANFTMTACLGHINFPFIPILPHIPEPHMKKNRTISFIVPLMSDTQEEEEAVCPPASHINLVQLSLVGQYRDAMQPQISTTQRTFPFTSTENAVPELHAELLPPLKWRGKLVSVQVVYMRSCHIHYGESRKLKLDCH